MKKIITLILAIAIAFTTNAQKEVKREYYDDAKKKLKSETPYKNGEIHGVQKFYLKYGQIKMEIPFSHGVVNGIKKEYFGYDEKLQITTTFVDGKENGVRIEYSTEGSPITETHYLNGEKNGIEKIYSPLEGKLISETNWVNGKKQGIQKNYDWVFSGKLKSEIQFVEDKEDGVQKNYNEDGTVWSEQKWINGAKDITEGGYTKISDQKIITVKAFADKGTWVQQYVKKSLYVNYTTQNVTDDNGKLVDRTTRGTKEFTVLEYEGEVVNGVREGKGTLYSYLSTMEDDIVMYVGEFKNGLPNGQGYLRPKFSKKLTGNPDKERYQIGFWKDGLYVGRNANWVNQKYDNGDTFEGEIVNGKINGYGTYTWKNQTYVITQNDGSKTYVREYIGVWKDNNLNGQGYCNYGDSTSYIGDFVNGKREGKGELIKSYSYWKGKNYKLKNLKVKTETLFKGEWKDDKFIKPMEY
jgi:antitoxin component YwqK of YwqJK toxin-antitoxin module